LKPETEREAEAQLAAARSVRDLNPGPKARAEGPLNELGQKGWQLVQVIEVDGHLAFYMEREVVSEDAESGSNGSPQGD
jgi:hypothetical protein